MIKLRSGSHIIALVALLSLSKICLAQVVYSEPEFPTQKDEIKIFFDASEGNKALEGFNGTVYAHTGVITSQSQNGNDWQHVVGNWGQRDDRVKMTSEGNDVYSLSYDIETYYGVSPGEQVLQLAFVFRNEDGSIVGRAADGSDIFLEIFESTNGLIANLIDPTENQIAYVGESIPISLSLNQESSVNVFLNESLILSELTDRVDSSFVVDREGEYNLSFNIILGEETIYLQRNLLVIDEEIQALDAPAGTKSGLNQLTEENLIFSLTAPGKDHVFLLCPENDFTPDIDFRMNPSSDRNSFWIELPTALFFEGENYYQYLVDGEITIADPFSTIILDPVHDLQISSIFGSAYPESASGHVSVVDIWEDDFDWTIDDFTPVKNEDLIVYELLMRDFLADKQYTSLLDTLDYLDRLGINAIELMPVQEFEANQSWGYNPSYHMALDKAYGTKDEFKQVVDECHKRGIAVIIDVVYNHAFSQSPLCQLYWDATNFRPSADNPWLNITAKHPFNVGYDFNHESPFTKDWVNQVTEYWIQEYRIDGFRFDLSKGFTQKNSVNNPDLMARYDQSRIDILTEYAEHIWSIDEDNIVILEHFADNSEERELASKGMLLWNNNQFQFAEAAMGYRSNLSGVDYTRRGMEQPALMTYLESHDEERMAYKIGRWGNSEGDYSTKDSENLVNRIAAAYTIFMSVPGPKLVWQFSELGFDFSINRCVNGTNSENCRLDPKPIFWSEQSDPKRAELYQKLSALFKLKANTPAFSTNNFDLDNSDSFVKSVHLFYDEMDVVSIANFDVQSRTVELDFPTTGIWYEFFTSETLEINSTTETLTLNPGGHKIYTSQASDFSGSFTTSTSDPNINIIDIFPNPVGHESVIQFSESLNNVQVFDLNGRRVLYENSPSRNISTDVLLPGMYIIHAKKDEQVITKKLIKS